MKDYKKNKSTAVALATAASVVTATVAHNTNNRAKKDWLQRLETIQKHKDQQKKS